MFGFSFQGRVKRAVLILLVPLFGFFALSCGNSGSSAHALSFGGDLEFSGDPELLDDGPSEGLLEQEGLKVVVLTTGSAKVTWTTPHYADSEVRWGTTPSLEKTPVLDPEPTLNHSVLLTDLQPGTRYYVEVDSITSGGGAYQSGIKSFETLRTESYAVRSNHPRLFFNSDDIPSIKEKLSGSHAAAWGGLKSACNSGLKHTAAHMANGSQSYSYARAYAFAALFSNEATYRDKAEDIALECAQLGSSGSTMAVRRRMRAITAVYDWLYYSLSHSTRETLRDALLAMYDRLDSGSTTAFVWGHPHGHHSPMLLVALTLYGESAKATNSLDSLLAAYRDGFFATWRNYGAEGGSMKGWMYTSWTLNMEVEVMAALKSAANIDWFQQESWLEKLLGWYFMGLREDGTLLTNGDARPALRNLDWIYALCVAHHYRNPQAKWFAQKVSDTIGIWGLFNFFDILWNDQDLVAEQPAGELSRLYRSSGHVQMRDTWDSRSVQAYFRSAPDYTLGHTHRDNNSFSIVYRKGLALDSGLYGDFGSSHHRNYYVRSIAHNTILVYDPDEQFKLYGTTYANDGGQRWFGTQDGLKHSVPAHIEDVLDPSEGYTAGGIVRYENTEEYTYALGDAAPSYSREKLTTFDRHFLWLKNVMGYDKPVMVVFDRVEATKGSFKKTYLLHTANRPSVAGPLVTAMNGGGVLFQQTVLPESPRIAVIGGSGKEYLVGGVNYMPSRAPWEEEEPGSYRVEVSPSSSSKTDEFLHVLHAADEQGSPPRSQKLIASTMTGCTTENWLLLFGSDRNGVEEVSYSVGGGSWKQLLLGMVPEATYRVSIDGVEEALLVASNKGCLQFQSQGAGVYELSRTVDS